jgi:hypothetical protein
MIARVPLLFCLLAGSSAAFAVAPQSKTFMPKKTVLAMSSGGAAPAPPAAVDLKVSLRGIFDGFFFSISTLFLTCFIRRIFFKIFVATSCPLCWRCRSWICQGEGRLGKDFQVGNSFWLPHWIWSLPCYRRWRCMPSNCRSEPWFAKGKKAKARKDNPLTVNPLRWISNQIIFF